VHLLPPKVQCLAVREDASDIAPCSSSFLRLRDPATLIHLVPRYCVQYSVTEAGREQGFLRAAKLAATATAGYATGIDPGYTGGCHLLVWR
jgi:hypothetical protein